MKRLTSSELDALERQALKELDSSHNDLHPSYTILALIKNYRRFIECAGCSSGGDEHLTTFHFEQSDSEDEMDLESWEDE